LVTFDVFELRRSREIFDGIIDLLEEIPIGSERGSSIIRRVLAPLNYAHEKSFVIRYEGSGPENLV
jgi:hypothetical protein